MRLLGCCALSAQFDEKLPKTGAKSVTAVLPFETPLHRATCGASGSAMKCPLQRHPGLSDASARLNHSVFRHDDDAVAYVVPIAVCVIDSVTVRQPRAVTDPRVLVDDDTIQNHAAADAQPWAGGSRRCLVVGFVEVGAEQNRAGDPRSAGH